MFVGYKDWSFFYTVEAQRRKWTTFDLAGSFVGSPDQSDEYTTWFYCCWFLLCIASWCWLWTSLTWVGFFSLRHPCISGLGSLFTIKIYQEVGWLGDGYPYMVNAMQKHERLLEWRLIRLGWKENHLPKRVVGVSLLICGNIYRSYAVLYAIDTLDLITVSSITALCQCDPAAWILVNLDQNQIQESCFWTALTGTPNPHPSQRLLPCSSDGAIFV